MEEEPPKKKRKHFVDTFACTYIVSVMAATNAELVTYPLDLTKTRLQIQGEAATKDQFAKMKHRGATATAIGIIKEEGFFKLWRGMTPALYRHAIYSGVRVCVYDYLRKEVAKQYTDRDIVPLWTISLCGIFAGCFGQWLASPADLIKIQMQMEGKRALAGFKPRYKNTGDAFKQVFKYGGIPGLWKGSVPNVYRAAFVNLGDLTAYDIFKQLLIKKLHMKDGKPVHFLSSFGAGSVAALLATPADVVKARVMNQPTDDKGKGLLYKGPMDCLHATIKKEGFLALYKGFIPMWLRLTPWALTFWVSYEQIRKLIGASLF